LSFSAQVNEDLQDLQDLIYLYEVSGMIEVVQDDNVDAMIVAL